jgi:hypothetical protein
MHMNCRGCKWWHNHYPHSGGVCTAQSGPVPYDAALDGLSMATSHKDAEAAIGDTMFDLYGHMGMTITHSETVCINHENK